MHPILLQIGSFSIKTYGFLIATGFLIGIIYALREAKRTGYDQQFVLDISFYMILGAIAGSRIFYIFTHFSYYWQNPLDVFKLWEGGLTFFGGFILAMAACIWMTKKNHLSIWKTLDLFAPSLAIGVFFGRLGCFFAGCCHGKPCDLSWAVTFIDPQSLAPLNTPLHPTQLYSSCGALVTFIILVILRKKETFDGFLAVMWILLYSSFRVIIEMFRGDPRGDLLFGLYPTSRVLAVALVIGSIIMLPILKARSKKLSCHKQ